MNRKLILLPILALCLFLSACGTGERGYLHGEGAQVLNLAETSEPPSLDSAKSHDLVSFKVLKNVMEGLLRKGENNKLILGMAASFPSISADKKTYTVKLRNATWSDGKRVTAYDFEYAWKRVLNPNTASEYSYMLYPILHAEEYNVGKGKAEAVGVRALDATTLQIKLKAPTPYFLDLLIFPTYFPQRKDIVEKYGDRYALEVNTMVYNGPFILSEWKHQESFQYRKNEQYWDKEAVKLHQVNHCIVKDNITSLNLYITGKVDLISDLDAAFVDKFKESSEKIVMNESYTTYLEVNSRRLLFKNKHIRQALALAVDKHAFIQRILKNGSLPAGGLVPPEIKGTETKSFRELSSIPSSYNPIKAKMLWEQGIKELKSKKPVTIDLVGDDTSSVQRSLQFLADQLQKSLGVSIQITSVPFKQKLERGRTGDFDLILLGWDADYNDPMTFLDLFMTGNGLNRGKWSNREYDSLIVKAKDNPDFHQRLVELILAEKRLMEESPVIPLCYRSQIGLIKPYVKGIVWYSIGPESLKWAYIQEEK